MNTLIIHRFDFGILLFTHSLGDLTYSNTARSTATLQTSNMFLLDITDTLTLGLHYSSHLLRTVWQDARSIGAVNIVETDALKLLKTILDAQIRPMALLLLG